MADGTDIADNYFVPKNSPAGEKPAWEPAAWESRSGRASARATSTDLLPPHRTLAERRRDAHRRRVQLPWIRLGLLGCLAGFGIWGTSTPGGVPARLEDFWTWVQGGVESATVDPQLRRAEHALNAWYERVGEYPDRADFDPDNSDEVPIGLSIEFCGPRHVVMSALTGRGTVSRLLVDGERVGDVEGNPGCPLDPNVPYPW